MKVILTFFFILHFSFTTSTLFAQVADPWIIRAQNIDPSNYYGITVANGMIGIVSSPEPFKIKDVVLAGAYDQYGRGRVSNFLRSFNLLNMNLEIDGKRMDGKNVTNFKQELDMKQAKFTASFDFEDKATISYSYYSLRQLPFTVLMDVQVSAKKDIRITSSSIMERRMLCVMYRIIIMKLTVHM
jgi:protein-glucosylgalactosylhydroxylysine glucosidase